jgi:hypothetical protein
MDYGMKNISASKSSRACYRRYKNPLSYPLRWEMNHYSEAERRRKEGLTPEQAASKKKKGQKTKGG